MPFKLLCLLTPALLCAAAKDCTLTGLAVSKAGAPVPGVRIAVMAGTWRPSYQSIESGPDGTFSAGTLKCGKYRVMIMPPGDKSGLPLMETVNIEKQPHLRVVIRNVDALASEMASPPASQEAFDAGPAAPDTAETMQLRRAYLETLDARLLTQFDAAPVAKQKEVYVQAVGVQVMRLWSGPQEEVHHKGGVSIAGQQDMEALAALRGAAKLIAAVSPDDAAAFEKAPWSQKPEIYLRAAATLAQRRADTCGVMGLYLLDSEDVYPGVKSLNAYVALLDPKHREQWSAASRKDRCVLLSGLPVRLVEMGRSLEQDGSAENVRAVATAFPSHGSPGARILRIFGTPGENAYEKAATPDQKLAIFRAAVMMEICQAITMLSL